MPASISVRPSSNNESCIIVPKSRHERRIILKSIPLECFSAAGNGLESQTDAGPRNFLLKRLIRDVCATGRLCGRSLLLSLICGAGPSTVAAAENGLVKIPAGSTINRIVIERRNIFDLEDPEENNAFYRFTNRIHPVTRENTVTKQLLFGEGDAFDPRLIEESERLLRRNKYLYDASITPKLNGQGEVDILVSTRDVWSLTPELTLSRSGGENKTKFGLEESNLFGTGQFIMLTHSDDVDRRSTAFEYSDRQVGDSWVSLGFRVADNSDGQSGRLEVAKPFHALDARWSAGLTAFYDDRQSALYSLGNEVAEYRHDRDFVSIFGGWSAGLRKAWVRRWIAGLVHDDNRFSPVPDSVLPQAVPDNRNLSYPFIGVELIEDRFEKSSNHDQIDRSEDFFLGTRYYATLGWSSTDFESDRDALLYNLSASHSFGSLKDRALLLFALVSGREEDGKSANRTASINARYYWRQSDKRLFFALIDATSGHNLDLDNPIEIGGDSGLRGYPLRYQSGDSRMLVSMEQRYFTDWYPFRLFRVGGAVFFDAGRVWGNNPVGGPNLGWLKDVGFGLRFAPTRFGTRKIVHFDIAFPLDGDPSIDEVQILFEAKRSF